MTASPVYVVLGGTGRLAQRLLPELRAHGRRVIAVSRHPGPADGRTPEWIQADLTSAPQWREAQRTLLHLLNGEEEIILTDLLLDRVSVTSMRRSISAATAFTLRTQRALAAEGLAVRVLAASTTAALAPPGLQTPYGRAKRNQALRYARTNHVDLVLLPRLLDITESDVAEGCTYGAAAATLSTIGQNPARRSLWVVRGGDPSPYPQRGLTGLPSALGALLLSRTVKRNNPAAHRRTSHEALALLPPRIRAQVDHHHAPERLIRALARNLDIPWVRTVTAGTQPAHPEENDEQRP